MKKNRLLFVTDYYLPGYKAGGPVKSVSSLCTNLKDIFNIGVVTSNSDFGNALPYSNLEYDKFVKKNGYHIMYLSKFNILSIKNIVDSFSPNIIYLNSFFSRFTQTILLLNAMKLIKSKIILAPRGELSQGALSIKGNKKRLFLTMFKLLNFCKHNVIFHSTDKIETRDIRTLFLNECYCIPNLTNELNEKLPNKKKIKGKLKVIFLSRISRKKNLLFALQVFKKYRCDHEEKVNFDIYGTLEDKTYWAECQYFISSAKMDVEIMYKGAIEPKNIPKILCQYHLFFLPTKNENFGHAIVEAMQSGVLPLISDQTPWNDITDRRVGWALNLNNKQEFLIAIKEVLSYSQDDFLIKSNGIRNYINQKLDNSRFVQSYIEMFNDTF
jgi:glycosyltransferase involved in cell wall biosynthesis